MLSARNVSKKFDGVKALDNISIDVVPRSIGVLIGPNGSGKSTLLRALSLLDPPSEGTIDVDDLLFSFPSEKKQNTQFFWPRVTVVFQQLFLWPHLSLKENIALPARKAYIPDWEERLDELIHEFGLEHFIDRYPNETSLGQRQRVALARAVLLNPSYLLLDEITSALDIEQSSSVLSYLQKLRENGMGILLITHLIGFARRAADTVTFLDKGQILESGGPELLELSKHERIRKFLDLH